MSDWVGDGDGSDALDELARWLRDAVARTGLTHEALAGRLYRDRTDRRITGDAGRDAAAASCDGGDRGGVRC